MTIARAIVQQRQKAGLTTEHLVQEHQDRRFRAQLGTRRHQDQEAARLMFTLTQSNSLSHRTLLTIETPLHVGTAIFYDPGTLAVDASFGPACYDGVSFETAHASKIALAF